MFIVWPIQSHFLIYTRPSDFINEEATVVAAFMIPLLRRILRCI